MNRKAILLSGAAILIGLSIGLYFFCPRHFCLRTTCAKRAHILADEKLINIAAQLYEVDTGRKPQKVEELIYNGEEINGWRGPYLTNGVPLDPWGRPYSLDDDERNAGKLKSKPNHGLESTSAPPAAGTLETHP